MINLIKGDCLEKLNEIERNSVHSIVTDPPYGIGFMNKDWDNSGISFNKEIWKKCFEVLKPGGYLLAFGGSRTYHRIACAIEDAGFEIRDTVMWIYSSGFPKSTNIGLAVDKKNGIESKSGEIKDYELTPNLVNQWQGWGTCLKPAFEPIIVARKPFKGGLVDNVITNGVGGLNIDECRVPAKKGEYDIRHYTNEDCFQNLKHKVSKFQVKPQPEGRFPANVILTYDDTNFNEVCSGFPNAKDGSASRYFYCAKASKKDKDEGLDELEENKVNDGKLTPSKKNIHPTVKPTTLMQYLVRLVTPKGGTILDPFMGSGSTGKAVMYENKERQASYSLLELR